MPTRLFYLLGFLGWLGLGSNTSTTDTADTVDTAETADTSDSAEIPEEVSALKRVLFPTFGNPTMPQDKLKLPLLTQIALYFVNVTTQ